MKTTILDNFEDFAWWKYKIPMIVVYEKPSDFPESYVARVWDMNKVTEYAVMRPTPEELRETIPEERFTRLDRFPNDERVIVEVWV